MKLFFSLMFVISLNSYAQVEIGQEGTGDKIDVALKSKEASFLKLLKSFKEYRGLTYGEAVKLIDGGVLCQYCPAETDKCAPRPDCKKDLYE